MYFTQPKIMLDILTGLYAYPFEHTKLDIGVIP
jgi:hypothetical protein